MQFGKPIGSFQLIQGTSILTYELDSSNWRLRVLKYCHIRIFTQSKIPMGKYTNIHYSAIVKHRILTICGNSCKIDVVRSLQEITNTGRIVFVFIVLLNGFASK